MNVSFVKLIFLLLYCCCISAQEGKKEFHFKKGEVLDVLILTGVKKDFNKRFDRYKETVYPVGYAYSYQPQSGFKIKKLTLGNHLPNSFVFGKWENIEKRRGFIANIEKEVADFHQQRRELFTYFGLIYFEIKKDTHFTISKNKYNVVTSFWNNDNDNMSFYNQWKKNVEKLGGKIVLKLQDGESPTGYYYKPSLITIVAWDSVKDFERFSNKYPLSSYEELNHVHQFQID